MTGNPLLLKFLRRYLQVHINLVTEGQIVDIVAEGIDLGLWSVDLAPSDMITVPVGLPRSFAVVASPEYFKTNGKPRLPPDLLLHSCLRIRLPNGALHRSQFKKDGQPVQIDVWGPITLDEASSRVSLSWTISASATLWCLTCAKTSRQAASFGSWRTGRDR